MSKRSINRIDSQTKRRLLPVGHQVVWESIEKGLSVGLRKPSPDRWTWSVKFNAGGGAKAVVRALSDVQENAGAYERVCKQAREIADNLRGGGRVAEAKTVGALCKDFASESKDKSRGKRLDADFRRLVLSTDLARVDLFSLREHHVKSWRAAMEATPKKRSKSDLIGEGLRTAGSIRRDLVALRSALNWGLSKRMFTSDLAWREALRREAGKDSTRATNSLSPKLRARVLAAADDDFRPFLSAMHMLPIRPGALAGLTVSQFKPASAVLTVIGDKGIEHDRSMTLPKKAAALFDAACKGRKAAAPIFQQPNGARWTRNEWSIAFRETLERARQNDPEIEELGRLTVYDCRHSVLTEMCSRPGANLLLIAKLAGTSLKMIEDTYFKPQEKQSAEVLSGIGL